MVCIGIPSSRMSGRFAAPMSNVREMVDPSLGDGRWLNKLCYSRNILMSEAYISLVFSLSLLAFLHSTYY